jgi:hypothetical protein
MSCLTPFETSTNIQSICVARIAISDLRRSPSSILLAISSPKYSIFLTGVFVYTNSISKIN